MKLFPKQLLFDYRNSAFLLSFSLLDISLVVLNTFEPLCILMVRGDVRWPCSNSSCNNTHYLSFIPGFLGAGLNVFRLDPRVLKMVW